MGAAGSRFPWLPPSLLLDKGHPWGDEKHQGDQMLFPSSKCRSITPRSSISPWVLAHGACHELVMLSSLPRAVGRGQWRLQDVPSVTAADPAIDLCLLRDQLCSPHKGSCQGTGDSAGRGTVDGARHRHGDTGLSWKQRARWGRAGGQILHRAQHPQGNHWSSLSLWSTKMHHKSLCGVHLPTSSPIPALQP